MNPPGRRRLSPEEYAVALICPMGVELAAMQAMLDEIHGPIFFSQDVTTYTLGSISGHNAVIAVLPYVGNNCAAIVTRQLGRNFPCITMSLLVGIGGGVPGKKHDIRLGDVVVSKPTGTSGGVVQIDMGKVHTDGRFERTGALGKPPRVLLAAVEKLIANYKTFGTQMPSHLSKIIRDHPNMAMEGYLHQGFENDLLFEHTYVHQGGESCIKGKCDLKELVRREPRTDTAPRVYYGTIGSSNAVVKDGITRELLGKELGVLCLEMEAAGVMNELPCLVIRGICDYADSHKNKLWQPYAAAAAAACAKEILSCIPSKGIAKSPVKEFSTDEKDCLKSLWYPEMESRIHGIDDATENTCGWLLSHPKYQQWLQSRADLLWIKGKPGAGKSTLMKYAVRRGKLEEGIIASFFFHDRGTDLEKTALGLYQSLLHQLLPLAPKQLSEITETYQKRESTRGDAKISWKWHEGELKNRLEDLLLELAEHRLRIYVDALDEAGEEVALQLVDFFESLVEKSAASGTTLSICFSCRHYPILSFDYGLSICVEEENFTDITTYVRKKLKCSRIGNSMAHSLEKIIIYRARGVFQWIILVMPEILRRCRLGRRLQDIEAVVREIPQQLEDLYKRILQNIPENERPNTVRVMQWICFALRPLSLRETRHALVVGKNSPYTSLSERCRHDELHAESYEDMERTIRHFSRGLAELKVNSVQFIHQSVKDYLIQGGLQLLDDNFAGHSLARGHMRLAWSCIRYMCMDEILSVDYPDSHKDKILPPMMKYVMSHWVDHARLAQQHHISWEELLELFRFLHPPTSSQRKNWERLRRLLTPQGSSAFICLHSLAQHNFSSVINSFLALPDVRIDERDDLGRTAIIRAAEHGHAAVVESLIQNGANVSATDADGRTALSCAAERGYEEIVHLLLRQNADTSIKDTDGRTALLLAAWEGHGRIVHLLLKHNVDIFLTDESGFTALSLAALKGHAKIVQSLLEHGADTSTRDEDGKTALSLAAGGGHAKVVRLLLEYGADISLKDKANWTAVAYACWGGYENIVQLLLQYCDDDSLRDESSWTAVCTSLGKYENIVPLLIKCSNNNSLKGGSG